MCLSYEVKFKSFNTVPHVTSQEPLLKVITSRTYREPLGEQCKNQRFNDEIVFRKQQSLHYISIPVFYMRNKYFKVLNGNFLRTSTGPSCGTPCGPNDWTFQGCLWDVVQTSPLNLTLKHLELTLTGCVRLTSEQQL